MSVTARLNGRLTQLAVGRHLPHRTVRARLTLLYGGLFLLSGAALMAITYALLVNAGFVFTLQSGTGNVTVARRPPRSAYVGLPLGFPAAGAKTHPSPQTLAHWRNVAQCMRQHGIREFPDPTTSVPSKFPLIGRSAVVTIRTLPTPPRLREISDRDGAIFVIPTAIDTQAAAFTTAATACGFMPDRTGITGQGNGRRTQVRQQLLVESGIALALMSLLSLAVGWLMAGRVLQPLEDSYEAQRQFVANASHELRAPLTRQRALIEVALASSAANAASLRKAHERVLASEQDLEQLIDGLLALTRGQAGLERRERFDLADAATRALRVQHPELQRLGLEVDSTLDPAPTDGDPRLLERLIANLIENAIRHNTPGGRVEITTGTRDRHPFASIANSGPTVPPEQIERLFQPFHRLGTARTHHDGGHGLGLSIVKSIADAHRAELSTRARAEGGLTIEVSFPPTIGAASGVTFATARSKRGSARAISP